MRLKCRLRNGVDFSRGDEFKLFFSELSTIIPSNIENNGNNVSGEWYLPDLSWQNVHPSFPVGPYLNKGFKFKGNIVEWASTNLFIWNLISWHMPTRAELWLGLWIWNSWIRALKFLDNIIIICFWTCWEIRCGPLLSTHPCHNVSNHKKFDSLLKFDCFFSG